MADYDDSEEYSSDDFEDVSNEPSGEGGVSKGGGGAKPSVLWRNVTAHLTEPKLCTCNFCGAELKTATTGKLRRLRPLESHFLIRS